MIRHLEVKNFKSLRQVSLDLERCNLLVGPNMSGKSNVVAVFRFLNKMVSPASGVYGLPYALDSQGGFAELQWRGADADLISISLEGDFPPSKDREQPQRWEYKLEFVGTRQGTVRVQEETLCLGNGPSQGVLIEKHPAEDCRVIASPSRGKISEVRESNRSALEFDIPDWEGNLLRNTFRLVNFFRLIPALMKQVNSVAAPSFLGENGDNLSAWLMLIQTRFPESFDLIQSAAKDILPDLESLFTWPTQQSTVFTASRERFLKTAVPIRHMSDGEICFIGLLSLLFAPAELAAPLYCIEEPENHLHPRMFEPLVGLLRQVQDHLGLGAPQILATTHSLQLVDAMKLEELIVVEKREGATILTRSSGSEGLRELLGREDVGLGDLYYSGALRGA
jgi:predicted ATPase